MKLKRQNEAHPSIFMLDYNAIQNALKKFDSKACADAIGPDGLNEEAKAERFLLVIRQSGCLVHRIPSPAKEVQRVSFLQWLDSYFDACPHETVKTAFKAHTRDAQLVETAFRRISDSLEKSEIGKAKPATQAWAMILRTLEEAKILSETLYAGMDKIARSNTGPVDPTQFKIKAKNGMSIDPDDIDAGLIQSLSTTLTFLGFRNEWFDSETKELVLPIKGEVTPDDLINVAAHTILSSQWLHLEKCWDRARFFEVHLKSESRSQVDELGQPLSVEILVGDDPLGCEKYDQISQERLSRISYEFLMGILKNGAGHAEPSKTSLSSPLESFVSTAEEAARYVLTDIYCVSVEDEDNLISGLSLKAWVRGYAVLERMANQSRVGGKPSFELQFLSLDELVVKFTQAGLTEAQAVLFVKLTTFQLGVVDLYDAPLLKIKDGRFCFYSPAFLNPLIARILLSRFSAINRTRNFDGAHLEPIQFADKGKRFERKILDLFKEKKIRSAGFGYRIDGVDYDCDVVANIGDTLFVFECKNYGIPHGRISELSHFNSALHSSGEQVSRIAKQLNDNPHIVVQHLGEGARWSKIVGCVLHALPWSMGKQGDVYFYDQSALVRFFGEGRIGVHSLNKKTNNESVFQSLRKGAKPTAEEFLRELENPTQLRFHADGWGIKRNVVPIGDLHGVEIPEWHRRGMDLQEQLEAIGLTPEKAKSTLEAFSGEPMKMVGDAIDAVFGPSVGLQRPNASCSCGSGKKYKHCCR